MDNISSNMIWEVTTRQIGCNPLFQRRYCSSLHMVHHLKQIYDVGSNRENIGIRNLSFNHMGNLLVTSSTNKGVAIWDFIKLKKCLSFEIAPYNDVIETAWLLSDENHLVTCSSNGVLYLLNVRYPNEAPRLLSKNIIRTAQHPDMPNLILSIGCEGKVLLIDTRCHQVEKLLIVRRGNSSSYIPLNNIHINPANCYQFCISGSYLYTMIYDKRNVSAPLHKLCPEELRSKENEFNISVARTLYNYDGTEILTSYINEGLYLFDRLTSSEPKCSHKYEREPISILTDSNFFGSKSEYIIAGSNFGDMFIWDKKTESLVFRKIQVPKDIINYINCLRKHPHLPILTIIQAYGFGFKIWMPVGDDRERD